ncbi:hypothetical protein [Paraburkholderia sp.]|uniref:hypothetical protein n=1 Tax=Paraburkholderia sp. TaxID=1926495 RepID=UPI0023828BBD|nr:hypothetical protein [Paraburkholderia sp.]MDE1181358.1 hypothetical protein [Paraburkholderia sp.]
MKKLLCVMLCALAAGCSTRGQVDPDVMQVATKPLTCANRSECDVWWQRAQTWVKSHSRYDLQANTDTLIQTAGPDGGKRALAFQITRAPNNDGTATIGFAAHCDSSLGCKPNPWEAGADFKAFVRSGTESPPPHGGAGPAPASGDAHLPLPDSTPAQSTSAPGVEPAPQ